MKTLLIENQKLGKIINQIIEGGFGIDSNDFLITNNSNEKFKQFAIKSCSINITDKVVEAIGDLNLEIDGFENEVLDFIVFTVQCYIILFKQNFCLIFYFRIFSPFTSSWKSKKIA